MQLFIKKEKPYIFPISRRDQVCLHGKNYFVSGLNIVFKFFNLNGKYKPGFYLKSISLKDKGKLRFDEMKKLSFCSKNVSFFEKLKKEDFYIETNSKSISFHDGIRIINLHRCKRVLGEKIICKISKEKNNYFVFAMRSYSNLLVVPEGKLKKFESILSLTRKSVYKNKKKFRKKRKSLKSKDITLNKLIQHMISQKVLIEITEEDILYSHFEQDFRFKNFVEAKILSIQSKYLQRLGIISSFFFVKKL